MVAPQADNHPAGGASTEVARPQRRRDAAPQRRERDYEPRKRGFDDDQ